LRLAVDLNRLFDPKRNAFHASHVTARLNADSRRQGSECIVPSPLAFIHYSTATLLLCTTMDTAQARRRGRTHLLWVAATVRNEEHLLLRVHTRKLGSTIVSMHHHACYTGSSPTPACCGVVAVADGPTCALCAAATAAHAQVLLLAAGQVAAATASTTQDAAAAASQPQAMAVSGRASTQSTGVRV
jgi:hypothetical protein